MRDRRKIARTMGLTAGLTLVAAAAFAAATTSTITIAPEGEPGTPLVVTGTIYQADGETPAAGARVHVYQTDVTGHYSAGGGQSRADARLAGDLVTDARGRYEIRTIHPGRYPGDGVPAHIHFVIETDRGRATPELWFEGDPALSASTIAREKAKGRWSWIRPVETGADGVERVVFDVRLGG